MSRILATATELGIQAGDLGKIRQEAAKIILNEEKRDSPGGE